MPKIDCHLGYSNLPLCLVNNSLNVTITFLIVYIQWEYWVSSKQTVKIDINIERDLAYALQAKECPQILFLRGNRILYREKGKIL